MQRNNERNPDRSPDAAAEMNDDHFGHLSSVGQTNQASAVRANDQPLPIQSPHADLMSLRAQFPFLQIMPFPRFKRTLYLKANTAQELKIPSEVRLLKIFGTTPFFITNDGNAEIPGDPSGGGANPSAYNDPGLSAHSFLCPADMMFYTAGLGSVSVIAQMVCNVQAIGWTADRLPRVRDFGVM